MQIRMRSSVLIRHAGNECLLLSYRTGGCTVFSDCRPYLEEINFEWQDMVHIEKEISKKFDSYSGDIREDFLFVLNELESQGFIEVRGVGDESAILERHERLFLCDSVNPELKAPLEAFCTYNTIPVELHLDLTDSCTERCIHCYVPKGQHNFLSYELAEKAIREFRELQGFSVHITGGECMLHPDFERVCELCKSLNINIIIFSNLTCCDARRIAFLREIDPQFINVSLYSMTPEEHDAITQLPGSWKKTMDTLLACENVGVHCRIATPLLKINQNAFLELKKFADAHHMHLVPSADIIAQSDHGCGNLASACSADEMRCVMQANKELFNRYDDVKMPACDAKVCDIGSGRLYLNAQGNYYPCDSMHDYVLGNVRENTFEEIWRGEKLEYLRGLKNKNFGACASCESRPWCKVCPAANFNATRNLFTPPPGHCEFAKAIREVYGKDN